MEFVAKISESFLSEKLVSNEMPASKNICLICSAENMRKHDVLRDEMTTRKADAPANFLLCSKFETIAGLSCWKGNVERGVSDGRGRLRNLPRFC